MGGLSLLMLGLFPTFAWASKEVRPVEMSVAAVKQYYRDRDYVSLFDALVFAGGEYTKVMRPTEIYSSNKIWFAGQYSNLEPAISKLDTIHFRGDVQWGPVKQWPASKTPQEVLGSGGSVLMTMGMGGENFERNFLTQRVKVQSLFPQTSDYEILLSSLFDKLNMAKGVADKLWASGQLAKEGWFSCSHMRVGHALDGSVKAIGNSPRLSVVSAWMYNGRFPEGYQINTCLQQDFLFVVGLLGSSHPKLEKIHLISDRRVGVGPVLKCALDLLYHPTISAGMDRAKALSVITALQKEGVHCE